MGYEPTADQAAILGDVANCYRAQFERRDFLAGRLRLEDLKVWKPGDLIQNWFRVASGHGFGKTKLVATVVNHAFDCLPSVVGYTFSTDWPALRDKLWKEIIGDRKGKGLPGQILEGALRLRRGPKHWIQARATADTKGRGKDRVHGLHAPFWFFGVEEADAAEDYVFDAITSNTTGGIGVVFLIGNPKRRTSRFHRIRRQRNVRSYNFSSLDHPNAKAGREVVPGGAVSREWIVGMIEGSAETGSAHASPATFVPLEVQEAADAQGQPDLVEDWGRRFRPDEDSFAVFWYRVADAAGRERIPVLIPDDDFRYQVLGIAPRGSSDNTLIPGGRIEEARRRGADLDIGPDGVTHRDDAADLLTAPGGSPDDPHRCTLGVDVARYGLDAGTVYVRFRGRVWRHALIMGQASDAYLVAVVEAVRFCRRAAEEPLVEGGPVVALESAVIRVDTTGGYGGGVVDKLKDAADLDAAVASWSIVEVNFNFSPQGTAKDGVTDAAQEYDDLITQIYDQAGEALKDLRLGGPALIAPDVLDIDLGERIFGYAKRKRKERKRLEPKDRFRERYGHSPDDGDGYGLSAAPDDPFAGCDVIRGGIGKAAPRRPGQAGGRRRGRVGNVR